MVLRGGRGALPIHSKRNSALNHERGVGCVVNQKGEPSGQQAEEELKKALAFLSATLEATTDGILGVDKEGRITTFNQRFVEMWNIPYELVAARDDDKAIAHVLGQLKDPEGFLKKVRELYSQPDAKSYDLLEFIDGRVFERHSQPQRIAGENVGRVWSFRDITERKQASQALENEVKTLESFVYTVSHDLKSPVVSMYGMASLLKEELGSHLTDQTRHYIDRIIFNASYMEKLILDLLELSRVGKKQQVEKWVEAEEVIREILKMNKESFQEKKVEVVVHSPFPRFTLEHIQLSQLFQNLITNAAKFMGDQSAARIEIGGRAMEKGVEFFVRDNGIGIDPVYHEKIFDIFHRLNEVEVEGTGVGMAIVKKVVNLNHGKIRLESQKGNGATFFVWLPQTSPSQKALPHREDK